MPSFPVPPPEFYTPAQASVYLSIPSSTLERWRREGRGPPFTRTPSRAVRYSLADLRVWMAQHRVD